MKDPEMSNALDRFVLELTGLRLAPQTTNKELDTGTAQLEKRIGEAIAYPGILAGKGTIKNYQTKFGKLDLKEMENCWEK